ncbi:hypothetical protein GCM10010185_30640 [Saccharothrix coeruleofusca]|uniref:Bacterial transcriptional activator domain-containing protein n=1 Tax=Saccharothrix coeruleofusca TaxID=33919 RepID=A0A918AP07_9PSEU|nr:hypothetical protein GCM10010185_30640 [Saccharothrix coeruleofusca]
MAGPADALAHYQRLRQRLAEELDSGLGQPLRRLHQQILTTDPALAPPAVTRAVHVPRRASSPPRLFTG